MKELVKPPLELKKRTLSPRQRLQSNNQTGAWGETQAKKYLQKKGYKLLECNLSFGSTEVDLIALDVKNNELVFVEVKTRRGSGLEPISFGLNWKQLRALNKIAKIYIKSCGDKRDYRFDAITIFNLKLKHHQNITWNFSSKSFY